MIQGVSKVGSKISEQDWEEEDEIFLAKGEEEGLGQEERKRDWDLCVFVMWNGERKKWHKATFYGAKVNIWIVVH